MEKPVFLLKEVREYNYLEDIKKVIHFNCNPYYTESTFSMQEFLDKCPKDIPLSEIKILFDWDGNRIKIYTEEKVAARPEQYIKDKKDYDEKHNQYLEDMHKYNLWKKENDKAQKIKYHEEELAKLREC